MSQLIDNLNIIESVKTEIKTAIENKGVDMTGVSFPGYASKIGEISGGGGWDQKSLTEGVVDIINLDNSASFVASNVFKFNQNIQTVNLPYAKTVGDYAFHNCRSLTQVNLPVCSSIGSNAFQVCSSLSIITIGYSSVCSLGGSNTFNSTPIASGTGSIYVPTSLVDAYKSASNWSYFSTQIFPISE